MLSRRLLIFVQQAAARSPACLEPRVPPVFPFTARIAVSGRPRSSYPQWPAAPSTCPGPSGRRCYVDDPRLRNARPLFSAGQLRRVVGSPSTHAIVVAAIVAAFAFYFSNLETVPVSGRTRFNCYSAESVREVGEEQAKMVLYELEKKGGRMLPDWDQRCVAVLRRGRGKRLHCVPTLPLEPGRLEAGTEDVGN